MIPALASAGSYMWPTNSRKKNMKGLHMSLFPGCNSSVTISAPFTGGFLGAIFSTPCPGKPSDSEAGTVTTLAGHTTAWHDAILAYGARSNPNES